MYCVHVFSYYEGLEYKVQKKLKYDANICALK